MTITQLMLKLNSRSTVPCQIVSRDGDMLRVSYWKPTMRGAVPCRATVPASRVREVTYSLDAAPVEVSLAENDARERDYREDRRDQAYPAEA